MNTNKTKPSPNPSWKLPSGGWRLPLNKQSDCGRSRSFRERHPNGRPIRYQKNSEASQIVQGRAAQLVFFQLQSFVAYKAKLRGVTVEKIDPAFTSQADSKTGLLGTRTGKRFVSPTGRVENADANAAFNIALAPNMSQLRVDRMRAKGA